MSLYIRKQPRMRSTARIWGICRHVSNVQDVLCAALVPSLPRGGEPGVLTVDGEGHPWQKTDSLLIDNLTVAHGRNPLRDERRWLIARGERRMVRDAA